jgi:hypothetical protein
VADTETIIPAYQAKKPFRKIVSRTPSAKHRGFFTVSLFPFAQRRIAFAFMRYLHAAQNKTDGRFKA